MVKIAGALAVLAISVATLAGGAPQAPATTPTPTPVPNVLAEPFKVGAEKLRGEIAKTPEWLRVYAGVVVGDWATVRADAQKLTEQFPQSPEPQIALAVGLEGTGDHEGAVAALRKAVEIDPQRLGGWVMLAQMNFRLNRLQDSALALERARKLAPQNIDLIMQLAEAYTRLGDAERASRVLAGATKAAPDNVEAWVNYLVASSRTSQAEAAWREFNQLRASRPGVAANVEKHLPADLAKAVPTPIPPTR
jgi:cytochrome c-type biogenesis protein CcmH/NrfG